jgi:hypothetical protein
MEKHKGCKGLLILLSIFLVNLLFRLPAIWQDLPPYTFCDEDIYTGGSFALYEKKSLDVDKFLAGGLNYVIPVVTAVAVEKVKGGPLTFDHFVLLSRLATAGILSSLSAVFVALIAWHVTRHLRASLYTTALYSLSPLILGISRYLYPDHFIIFFSSLFLLLLLRLSDVPIKNHHIVILAGVLAGCASVKVTGLILAIPLALSLYEHKLSIKELSKFIIKFAILFFIFWLLFNPSFPHKYQRFFSDLQWNVEHYKSGHIGLESVNNHLFYLWILLGSSFGVIAGAVLIRGFALILKSNRQLFLFSALTPMVYFVQMSSYKMVIDRNMMLVIPFFVIPLAYVLHRYAHTKVLILLLFLEPLGRLVGKLTDELRTDSRMKIAPWVASHLPAHSKIAVTRGCMYKIEIPENQNAVHGDISTFEKEDYDYYIEHRILSWSNYRSDPWVNLYAPISRWIYLNPGAKAYPELVSRYDAFVRRYRRIATLDGYSSSVDIYQRIKD